MRVMELAMIMLDRQSGQSRRNVKLSKLETKLLLSTIHLHCDDDLVSAST